jgi:hypothetical protein
VGRDPNKVKLEAEVPRTLWDKYETWLDDRGAVTHATLFTRLLRLFLDLGEQTQLQILFGKELPILLNPDEGERDSPADWPMSRRLQALAEICRSLTPQETKDLSQPDRGNLEQSVDLLRAIRASETDKVVADATRNVQARRSSPDRQQRRA